MYILPQAPFWPTNVQKIMKNMKICKKSMKNMNKYRPSVVGVRRPSPVVVVRRPFRRRRRPLSCPASVRRPSRRRRRPLSVRPVRPSSSSVVVRRPSSVVVRPSHNIIMKKILLINFHPPFVYPWFVLFQTTHNTQQQKYTQNTLTHTRAHTTQKYIKKVLLQLGM